MKFDQNGWLDVAIEVDILENTFDRQGYAPKYIVLHGTAGGTDAVAIAKYMKSTVGTNNPVSTHFVIGQDGKIVQCVPVSLAAFGNGIIEPGHASYIPDNVNPNLYTISIEHAKTSTDNSDELTEAQAQSSFELIACLCDTYGIPKQAGNADGGIIRHADIEPINRARCPGPYDYPGLYSYLQEEVSMQINLNIPDVAKYFGGNSVIWKCKINGHLIGHAILDFYTKFGGNALCGLSYLGLPLTDEQAIPGAPGCVLQRFERGVLIYDPSHVIDRPPQGGAVYLAHIDKGIGQDPRVPLTPSK